MSELHPGGEGALQQSGGAFGSTVAASPPKSDSTGFDTLESGAMSRVRAVFVDDNEADREIAQRLTSSGLATIAVVPTGDLRELQAMILDSLPGTGPNVVIMDYRLDDRQNGDGEVFGHRAGALAANLREHRSELPIVLLTTEVNKVQSVESNPAISHLFDLVVLKSSVATERDRRAIVESIVDLAIGFEELRGMSHDGAGWYEVASALGMVESERRIFVAEWPDPEPSGFSGLTNAILRGILADRPGMLLPVADAAARASLSIEDMEAFLVEVPHLMYGGPFSKLSRRVWRSRLEKVMARVGGFVHDGDADDWVENAALLFQAHASAVCEVCNVRPTEVACAICRSGVDQQHCVVASEMIVPAWSDPRSVCFNCIEGGLAEGERFSGSARSMVERIVAGDVERYL